MFYIFLFYRSPSDNHITDKTPVIPILVTSPEPEPAWHFSSSVHPEYLQPDHFLHHNPSYLGHLSPKHPGHKESMKHSLLRFRPIYPSHLSPEHCSYVFDSNCINNVNRIHFSSRRTTDEENFSSSSMSDDVNPSYLSLPNPTSRSRGNMHVRFTSKTVANVVVSLNDS